MKTSIRMLGVIGLLTGGAGAAYAVPAESRGLVAADRPAGCSEELCLNLGDGA